MFVCVCVCNYTFLGEDTYYAKCCIVICRVLEGPRKNAAILGVKEIIVLTFRLFFPSCLNVMKIYFPATSSFELFVKSFYRVNCYNFLQVYLLLCHQYLIYKVHKEL